jgi:hypothetical protein
MLRLHANLQLLEITPMWPGADASLDGEEVTRAAACQDAAARVLNQELS